MQFSKKKILHFFPKEKFSLDFYYFIKDKMSIEYDHYFYFYGDINYDEYVTKIEQEENVFFLKFLHINQTVIAKMKDADLVVFHTFFFNRSMIPMLFKKKIIKKSTWIIWGGDLSDDYEKKFFFSKIIYYFKRCIASRFEKIGVLTEGDYDRAKRWYNVSGVKYNVRYIDYCSNLLIQRTSNLIQHDSNKFLLGNSGHQNNKHLEVIKALERYKKEDFKLYVPLSYGGDMEYRQKVITYGFKTLGDKFIPITKFMNKEEYIEFLSKINVGLFAFKRQQALGNIRLLFKFQSKIYLNEEGVLFRDFKSKGYTVHSLSEIEYLEFEDLIFEDSKSINANKVRVSEYFETEAAMREWNLLFQG